MLQTTPTTKTNTNEAIQRPSHLHHPTSPKPQTPASTQPPLPPYLPSPTPTIGYRRQWFDASDAKAQEQEL